MPVMIMDEDLEKKIAFIEDSEKDSCSWTAQHRSWSRINDKVTIPYFRALWQKNPQLVIGGGAIYGWCGWNRYFVRPSGEVCLSEEHLGKQATHRDPFIARARAMRMRLSNEAVK